MLQRQLEQLITSTPELIETALLCREMDIPNHYIAGGCVTQRIWNSLSKQPPLTSIKDFDLVYFDSLSEPSESWYSQQINNRLRHKVAVDVVNQALVHTWFAKKFGCSINPYASVEEGIDSWLSAFAIGFRLEKTGDLTIYSPYGLQDAFNQRVKPNPKVMSQESYQAMTKDYLRRWPDISVEPWCSSLTIAVKV